MSGTLNNRLRSILLLLPFLEALRDEKWPIYVVDIYGVDK